MLKPVFTIIVVSFILGLLAAVHLPHVLERQAIKALLMCPDSALYGSSPNSYRVPEADNIFLSILAPIDSVIDSFL